MSRTTPFPPVVSGKRRRDSRESLQNEFRDLCKELNLRMEDVAVLFLASQGLLLMELLNLSVLTPSQIRKVTQRMLQLVEEFDRSDPAAGSAATSASA